ncbi:hypothetical protein MNBD_CHLOROFLEXI01-2964 [hydrothermal vent metagenome]|uniref:DUF3179 domain-containing protein n=1 Tax=hydrothermal vent metagenome TaxID=652676 RepID=A0A3B0V6C7_9ZZZZ
MNGMKTIKDKIPIQLNSQKSFLLGLFLLLMFLAACSAGEETAVSNTNTDDQANEVATSSPTSAASVAQTLNPPTAVPERISAEKYADFEMITLLPRDGIPAIDNPQFLSVSEANEFYDSDELIIGVEFNGDARAYSVPFLSNHEIVNDTVGGVKIAVTW